MSLQNINSTNTFPGNTNLINNATEDNKQPSKSAEKPSPLACKTEAPPKYDEVKKQYQKLFDANTSKDESPLPKLAIRSMDDDHIYLASGNQISLASIKPQGCVNRKELFRTKLGAIEELVRLDKELRSKPPQQNNADRPKKSTSSASRPFRLSKCSDNYHVLLNDLLAQELSFGLKFDSYGFNHLIENVISDLRYVEDNDTTNPLLNKLSNVLKKVAPSNQEKLKGKYEWKAHKVAKLSKFIKKDMIKETASPSKHQKKLISDFARFEQENITQNSILKRVSCRYCINFQ